VRSALGNFTAGAAQVTIEGKTVELSPNAAISFTMALYELGTNALKYGSLSVNEGAVEVRWSLEPNTDGERAAPRLARARRADGGPARARGFGCADAGARGSRGNLRRGEVATSRRQD
jgi:two-component sensor histidine kinase